MEQLEVNGKSYQILKLLGKGKGGYSYLAKDDSQTVVVKQIHHEPCDYYQFGDKMAAELRDYDRLHKIGIPMPKLLDADVSNERLVKEYIDGKTVYEMVLDDTLPADCIVQVKKNVWCAVSCKHQYRLFSHEFYSAKRRQYAVLCGLRVQ